MWGYHGIYAPPYGGGDGGGLLLFLGFQQFGVIPFEIRTLKKGHTEKWRARRIVYNKAIIDTEAPLVRGETEDICEFY